MAFVSLGAVIIVLCSWITVPFVIPFTLQTFGIFFLLFLFGGKRGSLSILLYLAMGMVGVPVFSGFNSGIGALLGITGGFLWGFVLSGCLYLALEGVFSKFKYGLLASAYLCLLACYVLGTVWYMFWVSESSPATVASALSVCVLPYIIPDLLKIFFAYLLSRRISRALRLSLRY